MITHILQAAGVNLKKHPYMSMTARECEINDKTAMKNTCIVLDMGITFIYKEDAPADAPPPISEGGVTMKLLFNKMCSLETTMTNDHRE